MTEKSQIVEKRIKSTIIRRRKEDTPPPPPEPVKPAIVAQSDEPEAAAPVASATAPAQTQEATAAPVAPAAVKKVIVTSELTPSIKQPETPRMITLPKPAGAAAAPAVPMTPEEEEEDKKNKAKKAGKKKVGPDNQLDIEGIGRVSTITQLTRIAHVDRVERIFKPSNKGPKRKRMMSKKGQRPTQVTVTKAIKRIVEMTTSITVGELAHQMNVKSGELIKKLMGMGTMATMNQPLDVDTATLLAQEFGFEIRDVSFNEAKILEGFDAGAEQNVIPRPPVVTVMGHVDHGKTSLLDAIRQTNVTAGEAGGITQHIGAYTVQLENGEITFLDTPGHEAFTAMRARGVSVTDLVVLVVAADDGAMPQTIESIDHAKAGKVPIVVAVNKIDKPDADIDRIKRQLAEHGLVPEEWGGDTLYSLVSAKQKQGVTELLENILLQTEVLELKANPQLKARGVVVEARLDRSRGPVATVLVQQGTLREGDILYAGCYSGRIRAMLDHNGTPTVEARPAYAVEILGLDGVPDASDAFHVVPDEQTATLIATQHLEAKRKAKLAPAPGKVSLEDFFSKAQGATMLELPVVLKADVQGSLEAVSEALRKIPSEKVKLRIIHGAVGGINESDVLLASASNAIIIGFNVRPETKSIGTAKAEGVDVKVYQIIYEMIEEVKLAMQGLLAPTRKEKYLGRAEIREVFTVSKIGQVAGCFVIDGKLVRGTNLRLLRNNVILHEGKISTLKRFKDDAKEVAQGFECGLSVEGYQDVKKGDVIEAFEVELIKTEL